MIVRERLGKGRMEEERKNTKKRQMIKKEGERGKRKIKIGQRKIVIERGFVEKEKEDR